MAEIPKLSDVQVLYSVITGLVALVLFILKNWAAKVDKKLDQKIDEKACIKQHKQSAEACEKLSKHKHAPRNEKTGVGGEVIL